MRARKPIPSKGHGENHGQTPQGVNFRGQPAFKRSPAIFTDHPVFGLNFLHPKPYHIGLNKGNT